MNDSEARGGKDVDADNEWMKCDSDGDKDDGGLEITVLFFVRSGISWEEVHFETYFKWGVLDTKVV